MSAVVSTDSTLDAPVASAPVASAPVASGTAPLPPRKLWPAVIALAVGGFGIGTTEFASMGLLPQIAEGVRIDIPTAGHLISAYALGVVVGAPLIAVLGAKLPRRWLLIALMAVFALGNAGSALSASYPVLMGARFLAGLPHGAYFGVAAVVAAAMVAPNRRSQAIATMMTGLTVSNIAGVPLATWLGQLWGWQSAYLLVSVIAVICLVAIVIWVPDVRIGDGAAGIRRELSALGRPQVWFALIAGMVGFGGMFATYSYVAPTMTTLAGMSEGAVVWVLAVYGVGMTVGMMLGGRLADRALLPTLYGGMVVSALVLLAFGFLATSAVGGFVAVFLLGISGVVMIPALQTRLMDVAHDGQALAAALNHATLNVANALGAWLGGIVLAAGLSYAWPSRISVVLPFIGLAVLLVGRRLEKRAASR